LLSLLGWTVASANTCPSYADPELVAEVASSISEASGLAASRGRSGVFFTHGDKGEEPLLIAFDATGQVLDEHLVADANNEDWEDLVAAPCPDSGDCLYIGDIGDNDLTRAQITVYVVREPEEGDTNLKTIATYTGVYGGGARDAETLLVHPCSGQIYLVTKDPDGRSEIYRFPESPGEVSTLEAVATISIDAPNAAGREVTGGAWDEDGDRLALRTQDRVFEWQTDPQSPDAHWASEPVELVGAVEVQGEGLTYGTDGHMYGIGEGAPSPLSRWTCEDLSDPADAECTFPQTGRKCGCSETGGIGGGGSWYFSWLCLLTLLARRRAAN
jgi:hypothetical protein